MRVVSADEALGWIGAVIDDRVVVEEVIGEGGFGIVYRGRHLGFDEPVAVKCLKIPASLSIAEQRKFVEHMRAEARLMLRMSRMSASIVQALDVGAATSPTGRWTPYIVMELLEGRTLAQEISARQRKQQPPLSLSDAVAELAPAARALAVVHQSGAAHLDVKPANLFVVEHGARRTMKVLDLGIARTLVESDTLTGALTREGAALCAFTPRYAAPEQFHEQHGRPGAPSDVFALALILVELASGAPALQGSTALELYIAAARDNPRPDLASRGVAASAAVQEVVRRALEVDPQRRYPDAGALWDALEAALASGPTPDVTLSYAARAAPPALSLTMSTSPALVATSGFNRVCTVLFAELRAAADLEPEEVGAATEECFGAWRTHVEDAGGSVEEAAGDTLMAVFGLHTAGAGAAERAVHAARRMLQTAAPSTTVRVGIETGRVFVRLSDTRGRGIAIAGAPVTRAAALQRAAPAGAVVIGHDTHRQVAGLFEVEPIGVVSGEGASSSAHRVIGMARGRAALDVMAGREFHGVATRFVGRAAEMESLETALERVTGEPASILVTLIGAPGVGKSRLLIELAARLESGGFAVLAAPCSALHTHTSFALVAALLRGKFLIHEDDPREVAADKIRRGMQLFRADADASRTSTTRNKRLRVGALDGDEIVVQLAYMLGYASADTRPTLGAEDRSQPIRERMAAAFAALIACAGRPVALVCDDLQWADEPSLDLFDELLVRLGGEPLFIACAAQPALFERRPSWQSEARRGHSSVPVGPLARRHLEAMARDRLQRAAPLSDDLVHALAERADGHPLTLVESLHLLIDVGAVDVSVRERWTVDEARAKTPSLPTSIHGVVQARLDLLSAPARDLACRAAVVGRTFWEGALAGPGGWTPALKAALDELCQRRIVRAVPAASFPDEREYAFVESTAQQVAYEILSQATRRELHGAVAEWLAQKVVGDAGAALLASHYERAGAEQEAAAAWARAGAHAAALGQNAEAEHCYEAACRIDDDLAALPEDTAADPLEVWPERVGLRVDLGDVLRRMGKTGPAEERYRQARERIARTESHLAACWDARIDFRLALVQHTQGAIEDARALAERAVAGAEKADLIYEQAQMLALLVTLHGRARDWAASVAAFRRGLRLMKSATERDGRWSTAISWLLRNLGVVAHWRGRLGRAERCGLQAARYLDEQRDPDELARVLNNVAAARYQRNDYAAAQRTWRRVLDLAERSGNLFTTMTALANLGEVERVLGRPDTATVHLEQALQLGESIGALGDLPDVCRNLALALSAQARHEEALALAERALELARSDGGQIYLPLVTAAAAEIGEHAREGGLAEAAGKLEALIRK